ncbi:hypothetical protein K501DRAFT_303605 [Backusella circina FSU 941]|nr:hypothetical protein K501DRAFT_303605 [Backusella circina FSU 941]
MNKLPTEVLSQIFVFLHQQDKVECMTVCRKWANAIESCSLFQTIRIDSDEQLNRLMAKVQQEPKQGLRVERLILNLNLHNVDMNGLPLLFPNVRVFIYYEISFDLSLTKRQPYFPWHKTIQHMSEYPNTIHAQQTLSSGICPRLTRIAVFEGKPFTKPTYLGKDFIGLLKNAPVLKVLSLGGFDLALTDFELLHKNVPLLNSLTIRRSIINCDFFPSDISPATAVTTFSITPHGQLLDDEIRLLQYLGKKYTHLSKLFYDVRVLDRNEYNELRVYADGLTPFMESLAQKLKTFEIDMSGKSGNLFRVLDNAGCQIRDLTLHGTIKQPVLEQLAQSNQAKHIRKLTIGRMDCDHGDLQWLEGFTGLEELNITNVNWANKAERSIIDLNHLLAILGDTLTTLILHDFELAFQLATNRQYKVKHLVLYNIILSQQTDEFISQSFPDLRTIKFIRCGFIKRNFLLPNINLFHIQIMQKFPLGNNKILVSTLKREEQRWYTARHSNVVHYSEDDFSSTDASVFPAFVSLPFDQFKGQPYMSFTCNSIRDFSVVNTFY